VVFAATTLAASWALAPGADPHWVYLPTGERFGDTCLFLLVSGMPCPQCGMTRAFVLAARGDLVTSFLRNPAGLGLFLWIVFGGVMGAVRLARRDGDSPRVPHEVVVGWSVFWLLGLYVLPYVLRLAGINPLP
jgi:Protein of unknown function (DUF2752)